MNAVGVDLNTASAPLLARVSGLGAVAGRSIVAQRDANGAFKRRQQLLEGQPASARRPSSRRAGFLRIRDGDEPLDASAVHPETYPVVEKILAACGRDRRAR